MAVSPFRSMRNSHIDRKRKARGLSNPQSTSSFPPPVWSIRNDHAARLSSPKAFHVSSLFWCSQRPVQEEGLILKLRNVRQVAQAPWLLTGSDGTWTWILSGPELFPHFPSCSGPSQPSFKHPGERPSSEFRHLRAHSTDSCQLLLVKCSLTALCVL